MTTQFEKRQRYLGKRMREAWDLKKQSDALSSRRRELNTARAGIFAETYDDRAIGKCVQMLFGIFTDAYFETGDRNFFEKMRELDRAYRAGELTLGNIAGYSGGKSARELLALHDKYQKEALERMAKWELKHEFSVPLERQRGRPGIY
jgi:hypothetical protein